MKRIHNINTGEICYVDKNDWKKAATEGGQIPCSKKSKKLIDSEEFEGVRIGG